MSEKYTVTMYCAEYVFKIKMPEDLALKFMPDFGKAFPLQAFSGGMGKRPRNVPYEPHHEHDIIVYHMQLFVPLGEKDNLIIYVKNFCKENGLDFTEPKMLGKQNSNNTEKK